jgi:hypothetical protein
MQQGLININDTSAGHGNGCEVTEKGDVIDIICPGRVALGLRDESRPRPAWESLHASENFEVENEFDKVSRGSWRLSLDDLRTELFGKRLSFFH